jgi:hypothetical protein
MCGKKVPPEVLEKIDRAIAGLFGPPRGRPASAEP